MNRSPTGVGSLMHFSGSTYRFPASTSYPIHFSILILKYKRLYQSIKEEVQIP